MDELKAHNRLVSDTIEVGQKLALPAITPDSAAAVQYKMTTPIAPGVLTPDTLETSLGTLHLRDGVPNPDTIETIYDNLDRSRALQAYLLALPIVNQASMRESLCGFGPKAPEGKEISWVQTIPGKGWFMILRLYGPLKPWFDQTWRPGEIELQP